MDGGVPVAELGQVGRSDALGESCTMDCGPMEEVALSASSRDLVAACAGDRADAASCIEGFGQMDSEVLA